MEGDEGVVLKRFMETMEPLIDPLYHPSLLEAADKESQSTLTLMTRWLNQFEKAEMTTDQARVASLLDNLKTVEPKHKQNLFDLVFQHIVDTSGEKTDSSDSLETILAKMNTQ